MSGSAGLGAQNLHFLTSSQGLTLMGRSSRWQVREVSPLCPWGSEDNCKHLDSVLSGSLVGCRECPAVRLPAPRSCRHCLLPWWLHSTLEPWGGCARLLPSHTSPQLKQVKQNGSWCRPCGLRTGRRWLSHEWPLGKRPTHRRYMDTVGPAGLGQAQGQMNTVMWGSQWTGNVMCEQL